MLRRRDHDGRVSGTHSGAHESAQHHDHLVADERAVGEVEPEAVVGEVRRFRRDAQPAAAVAADDVLYDRA